MFKRFSLGRKLSINSANTKLLEKASFFLGPDRQLSYPTSLFRLYNPAFSATYFLPITSQNSKTIFSWPYALKRSVSLKNCENALDNDAFLRQELSKIKKQHLPVDLIKKAMFLMERAELEMQLSDVDEAKATLIAVLTTLKEIDSLESINAQSSALQLLGATSQLEHRGDLAIKYYEQSLKLSEKVFRSTRHPSQAMLLTMLGMAWGAVGNFARFEEYFIHVISGMKACFPESPERWVDFESSLAVIYCFEGSHDKAIKLHEQCHQVYSKMRNGSVNSCIEKNNWAVTMLANQDVAYATKLFDAAVQIERIQQELNPALLNILRQNKAFSESNHVPKNGLKIN